MIAKYEFFDRLELLTLPQWLQRSTSLEPSDPDCVQESPLNRAAAWSRQ